MEARIDQNKRDETYRIYITESLRLSPQGKWLVKSYMDMVNDQSNKKPEPTGEEIVDQVMLGAGLTFKE